MNRLFICLVGVISIAWIVGCSNEESGADEVFKRDDQAEKLIREQLEIRGLHNGYNDERKAIVSIASENVRVDTKGGLPSFTEAKRRAAFEKAKQRAIVHLAEMKKAEFSVADSSANAIEEVAGARKISKVVKDRLTGYKTLMSAESCNGSDCQFSVAVVWSEKLQNDITSAFVTKCGYASVFNPGQCTVAEYIAACDPCSFVGERSYVDRFGDVWIIGTSSRDVDENFSSENDAFECCRRILGVEVKAKQEYIERMNDCDAADFREDIKIVPMVRIIPKEDDMKIVKKKFENPIRGKTVEMVVCAVRISRSSK